MMSFWGYRDYVPVARRRANAAKEVAKLKKQGRAVSPVVIEGRKIARSFWGKAWCDNLERYSDFANRLPRGKLADRDKGQPAERERARVPRPHRLALGDGLSRVEPMTRGALSALDATSGAKPSRARP